MIYRNGVFLRKKKTGGVINNFPFWLKKGKKGSLGLFRQLERRPNLNWFNIHITSRCVQQKKILGWQVQKNCGLVHIILKLLNTCYHMEEGRGVENLGEEGGGVAQEVEEERSELGVIKCWEVGEKREIMKQCLTFCNVMKKG